MMIKILIVLAIVFVILLFIKEIEIEEDKNNIDLTSDGRIRNYEARRDWEKRNDIK